jgi:hypothetical protein
VSDAIVARDRTPMEPYELTVHGRPYREKDEANAVLRSLFTSQLARFDAPDEELGRFRGLSLHVSTDRDSRGLPKGVTICLGGLPEASVEISAGDLSKANVVTRLENKAASLEAVRSTTEAEAKRLRGEGRRAQDELHKPFRHREALDSARMRLKALDEKLAEFTRPPEPAPEAAPGPVEARLYKALEEQARAAAAVAGRPLDTEQLARLLAKARTELHAIGARTGQPLETLATLALERVDRHERAPSPRANDLSPAGTRPRDTSSDREGGGR